MHTKKIATLFKHYLTAFKKYDLSGVVSCYHIPCTLHTPEKVVLLEDLSAFEQEFNDIFTQLKQAQMSDICATKASYTKITERLLLVSIDWVFVDGQGEVFADFCAVYHLTFNKNELEIINVVSHDLSNSLTLAQSFSLAI